MLADSSADVHTTGTTAFYRPAGSGSFDVTASSTDAQSGILDYSFPVLAGFTGSGAGATRTYTLATPTEPNGTKPVTARNQALLSSSRDELHPHLRLDRRPTGGALTVNGTVARPAAARRATTATARSRSASRTDYNADAVSGVATSTLTREHGTLNADACSAYGAPTTLVGTPAQSGLATGCYRYILTGTDNVGNTVDDHDRRQGRHHRPGRPVAGARRLQRRRAHHRHHRLLPPRRQRLLRRHRLLDRRPVRHRLTTPSPPSPASPSPAPAARAPTPSRRRPSPTAPRRSRATNDAGRTNNSTFTLTADSTAPLPAASMHGERRRRATTTTAPSRSRSTDYTDGALRHRTRRRSRASTRTLVDDACCSFAGADSGDDPRRERCWHPQPPAATATRSPAPTTSATRSRTQSTIVKVDTTAPTAPPALTLANATGDAPLPGHRHDVWFRPPGSGQFDVTASSTDAQTGIATTPSPPSAPAGRRPAPARRAPTSSQPARPSRARDPSRL